ncbi:MAG: hypothetical protein RBU27_10650 [Bacteroidota bacterium]|jgi:hypothetical protein|nr:hypothetical protein [Bacteroidota bacterium]
MFRIRQIFPALFFLLMLASCSDDDPTRVVHHVNPVWTPDGKTVVAGYDEYHYGGDPPSALRMPSRLAVMDVATRATRIIDLGTVATWHTLYSFDPSGTALAFVQDGSILFYDLQGRQLLSFAPTEGGTPSLMTFNNTGNSFVWVGTTADGYTINNTVYDANGWRILATAPLATVVADDTVTAITLTSQLTYALRTASGTVREVGFSGNELNTFTVERIESDNPWHERLVYYNAFTSRFLYAIDREGMMRMDLNTGGTTRLVKGRIIDFDVSSARESMFYETRTGDAWIATTEGLPLSLRLGESIKASTLMARFSPAGNGIAMVARHDVYADSLHILLYRTN